MRIIKEPEERKAEILDAAEKLFLTKGYSKTTIIDILNEIGIAKGTFYYYFKSKEEAMEAMVMRIIEAEVASARKILKKTELSIHERVFRIFIGQKPKHGDKKMDFIEKYHESGNAELHQKSMAASIQYMSPVLKELVEQGIETGDFSTPYPGETSEILLAASSIIFDYGMLDTSQEELLQRAKAFIHTMEITLGAKAGSFDYMFEVIAN